MVAIIAVVGYLEVGTNFLKPPGQVIHGTTVSSTVATTTIPAGNKTTATTTVNSTLYFCNGFSLSTLGLNSTVVGRCLTANGSAVGVWIAAGYSGRESVTVKGADGKTYVSQTSYQNCLSFYQNFTGPPQIYTITLRSGVGGGSCGNAQVKLNYTTVPPPTVYSTVINGNFSTGTYAGWTVTNPGFGTAPLNITYANAHRCYLNNTWTGYNGNFFATTYGCGTAIAAGNITSSQFYVNASQPFLNFKIISPSNSNIYVEILSNGVPRIVAHYNTYNASLGAAAPFTFRNASIPLTTLATKAVQVRVVDGVSSINSNLYIAVGDFATASRPVQTMGIVTNSTFS